MDIIQRKHVFMDQEGGTGGGGGGGGGTGIQPAQAREFVGQFVHDPRALEGMADADVIGYHGRITQALDKVRPANAFPQNWREQLALGADGKPNAGVLKRLERYNNPKAVADALVSVQERISAGELRSQLPQNATPEQITAWRAENGIPEAADKYDIKLPTGMAIKEEDREIIGGLLAEMHPAGLSNTMASKFVESYYKVLDKQAAAIEAKIAETKTQTEDKLRAAWGSDYRQNKNNIDGVVSSLVPAGSKLAEKLKETMALDAEFAEFMAAAARQINPVTTLIPGSNSENMPQAIDAEIKTIEAEMAKGDNGKYYNDVMVDKNGHKDTAMAHRYRELIAAKERTQARG